jgi:hypothetical protein
MAKSYTPTEAMRNNAKSGLSLREKYGRGGLDASQAKKEGVGSGVTRASNIINGNLTLETVKRMYSFFYRHEKNFNPKKKMPDGGPTAGTIAWKLWGGSAGFAWARNILREEKILKSYTKEITEKDSENKKSFLLNNTPVNKAVNEELMQATFIALVPEEVDLHGDIYSEEEVRKACHSFNQHSMKANLCHLVETNGFSIVESYITPADIVIGDKSVTKGTWLSVLQFHDEELWNGVKEGKFVNVSIGAHASVEYLEDSEEDEEN